MSINNWIVFNFNKVKIYIPNMKDLKKSKKTLKK